MESQVKFGFSAVSDVRKKTAPKRDSQAQGFTRRHFDLSHLVTKKPLAFLMKY